MTEPPVPVPFGSGKPARVIYASLFGELTLYPQPPIDPDRRQDIVYSLFNARSAALGLDDHWPGRGGGEIGDGVVNFDVVLGDDKQTPVQPFLAVVGDVIARLGKLRLDAIQVRLPERDRPEPSALGDSSDWFALCHAALWVPVRVTLDSPDERITAMAARAAMDDQMWDVFKYDSPSEDHLVLLPISPDTGDVYHRVTFTGTLAEWSFDALGWLAAFLDNATSRQGIRGRLVISAAVQS